MTQVWPEALDRFLAELRRWAPRTNLVGSEDSEALRRHVEDSLAAAAALPRAASVVDLGSGAGFPGIPLAIARPDLDLVLVEIRERRAHFLRHVVRTLELTCRVERRRIEEPMTQRFDYALLRAVAAPQRAVELARPWLAERGEAWIWIGPEADVEGVCGSLGLASGGRIVRVPASA